jgi:hypothetical protein
MVFSKHMPQKQLYQTLSGDNLLHTFTLPAEATDGVNVDN